MVEDIPGTSNDNQELTAEVAELLHGVTHRMRRATGQELEPLGVTWAQVRALRTVYRCGRPIRMSELAARLRIARRSATSVVDELVGRGLVTRLPDPSDRRAVAVEVAAQGAALLAALDHRRRDAAARLTSTLSQRELTTLRNLLRRLDRDSPRS